MNIKNKFGLRAVFQNYTIKDWLKDCAIPFFCSLIISILTWLFIEDILALLSTTISVAISILPAMLALLLTGYVFLLSIIYSNNHEQMLASEQGIDLLKKLNSSFYIAIATPLVSTIFVIIVYLIYQLQITFVYANFVNYLIYFFVVFSLIKSITVQFGVLIDLYNCGHLKLIDKT